ncbi:prepilin peptidase [Brevibacillus sp. GCM10020057]|uniref:prepilin peptidase n=1 Tax=Brevibacillus sp. GCM10020057 TaxID=3317327 RepID=UPI00362A291F
MLSHFVVVPVLLAMIIAVYTDLRRRLIYDWLTLPGIAYFLLYHAAAHPDRWTAYALGVLATGGISLLMALVSKGQLGGGDIKLFALVGAAVGWEAGLYIMCLTYLLAGLVVILHWAAAKWSGKQASGREIPLAPFIAGGTSLLLIAAAYIR